MKTFQTFVRVLLVVINDLSLTSKFQIQTKEAANYFGLPIKHILIFAGLQGMHNNQLVLNALSSHYTSLHKKLIQYIELFDKIVS